MICVKFRIAVLLICCVCVDTPAQDASFVPLFNGKNLDGWVRINTDESTWSVRDGMLICSGKPIGELRTTRMYENFILEVEWRHMKPGGNAGIFVWADDITAPGVPFHRGIEVQVLENAYGNSKSHTTHGDIFPIHGATMDPVHGRGGSRAFPTENRSKPSPEWNHYRIECRDGDISLAVNGKIVTRGKNSVPRKGYLCVESEGGVVHYRNMRIRELPSTGVEPAQTAIADRGYRCLYTGIDLDGWRATGTWKPHDWQLQFVDNEKGTLTTAKTFGDVGLVFDFKGGKQRSPLTFHIGGGNATIEVSDRGWHRVEAECRAGALTFSIDGKQTPSSGNAKGSSGPLKLEASHPIDFANIYVREL